MITNSTQPGHVHSSDPDAIKATDEVMILILGVVVFATFAVGLVSQVGSLSHSTSLLRTGTKRRHSSLKHHFCFAHDSAGLDEEEYYKSSQLNGMNVASDLEHAAACTAQLPLRSASTVRSATRYGGITSHTVDVRGVTKMVLVVDAAALPHGGALDAYAEWFADWWRRMAAYREQRLLDERAL